MAVTWLVCVRPTDGGGARSLGAPASALMAGGTAQFERDDNMGIAEALDRARVESLRAAACRPAASQGLDRTQTVFRTDDGDRSRGELFLASARREQSFVQAHANDECGELVVARRHSLVKSGRALHDCSWEIGEP
jgi:hypothetical protein